MAVSARLGRLFFDVLARTDSLDRDLGRAGRSVRAFSQRVQATSRRAQLALFGAGGLIGFAVKAASDAEEIGSKFDAVFKTQAAATRAWADQFAAEVGRSRIAVQEWLAQLQDTFVPLGFSRDRAADLSKQLTRLAVDIGSFNNAAEPEVVNLLTSALVGNHEAVRRFGVLITQATLDQELMNMGLEGGARAATELQKVQARLNLIMRSTTDAQGDAARTAGSFANRFKALRGDLRDVAVELGQAFLPGLSQLIEQVREHLPQAREWLDANGEQVLRLAKLSAAVLAVVAVLAPLSSGLSSVIVLAGGLVRAVKALNAAMIAMGVSSRMARVAIAGGLVAAVAAFAAVATRAVVAGESWSEAAFRMARAAGLFRGAVFDLAGVQQEIAHNAAMMRRAEERVGEAASTEAAVRAQERLLELTRERARLEEQRARLEAAAGAGDTSFADEESTRRAMATVERFRDRAAELEDQLEDMRRTQDGGAESADELADAAKRAAAELRDEAEAAAELAREEAEAEARTRELGVAIQAWRDRFQAFVGDSPADRIAAIDRETAELVDELHRLERAAGGAHAEHERLVESLERERDLRRGDVAEAVGRRAFEFIADAEARRVRAIRDVERELIEDVNALRREGLVEAERAERVIADVRRRAEERVAAIRERGREGEDRTGEGRDDAEDRRDRARVGTSGLASAFDAVARQAFARSGEAAARAEAQRAREAQLAEARELRRQVELLRERAEELRGIAGTMDSVRRLMERANEIAEEAAAVERGLRP